MAACVTIRKFEFWALKIRVPNASKTRFCLRFPKTDTTPSLAGSYKEYISSRCFSCGFYLHICPGFSHGCCLQLLNLKNGRGKMVSPKGSI